MHRLPSLAGRAAVRPARPGAILWLLPRWGLLFAFAVRPLAGSNDQNLWMVLGGVT